MSGYLLDTTIFLWSLVNPDKLNRKAAALLEDSKQQLFLSPASSWEISIKWGSGKLRLPEPPTAYVTRRLSSHGIRSLPITHLHALAAGELPRRHLDPFDRMLIAQAVCEGLVLLTADPLFRKYEVETLWCGK
jgi:PIN domain nuclease of toxin-antitoxin system